MLMTTNIFRRVLRVFFLLNAAHKVCNLHSPHVDQILSERDGIGISADGDRAVSVAAFALLAVWNSNHGTRNLTNLGDLGASFANDAADQVVWHSHFMLLRIGLRSTLSRTQLWTGEGGESCAIFSINNCQNLLKFTYNLRYLTGWFRLDLTEWHRPIPKLQVLPEDSSLVQSSVSDFSGGEKERRKFVM